MAAQAKSTNVVNGETPSSATLRHLLAYPAVQDGVRKFKEIPVLEKSVQLSTTAYNRLAAPFLSLFSKPYGFVSPYIERVDQLGDQTLSKVDERFPAVKKPSDELSAELMAEAKKAAYLPVRMSRSGADFVLKTYHDEYTRIADTSPVAHSKAAVFTAFKTALTMLELSKQALVSAREFLEHQQNKAKKETAAGANGTGA
ncbi:hypothetical protein MMYC01_201977 [Madurella mycetomatis]|uniref:Uncharacterized protein n=1 Tax=Madurella mycetomatis TaxID=100816 RepID=A0A175WHE8_9PEZI|nr:hypothetical protein MMYC01_201977 [Madurella mycetomatis]